MTRPIQASLDLQVMKQNLAIVRRAAPEARVWSVVKANAYGHGIERVWSALGATDGFAMLNLEEAITLRERGWKGPILMLEGFFHAQDLEAYDTYRLTTCIHSNWQLKALQNARLNAPLDIYVKVNSGMNRLGFQPERAQTVWQQLRAMRNVGEMTLMSHFAQADHPEGIGEAGVLRWRRKACSVHTRYQIRQRRCGIPRRIMTGSGQALFCMARRRQDSGGILPIPD